MAGSKTGYFFICQTNKCLKSSFLRRLIMELGNKLEILTEAAKYDASCSSSGSNRKNKGGEIGNSARGVICHSWSDDGRCISLLKILFTNYCIYDCAYCINRSSNDLPRSTF